MSQEAFLKAFDAAAVDSFANLGIADAATYTAPGGATVACTVMVDNEAQIFGDDGAPISGLRTTVALQLSEVSAPARYGIVRVGSLVYELAERVALDESLSTWVVTRG